VNDAELGALATTLELQRPLVWLDLETTGVFRKVDRVVQLGAIKISPDGTVVRKKRLVNPQMLIPPEATEIHHITDDMVKDEPTFEQLATSLAKFIHMVDFGGYNVGFDLDILAEEFTRCRVEATLAGRIVDANKIAHEYNRRTLVAMYERYTGKPLMEAHDALVDTEAAAECFIAQLAAHPDLPRTVEGLHAKYFETPRDATHVDAEGKFAWRYDEAVFTFGKYGDTAGSLKYVASIDRGYLQWMLRQNFAPQVERIVQDALVGKFPVRIKSEVKQ
jgi:DNA polymerase III subunit epsilon